MYMDSIFYTGGLFTEYILWLNFITKISSYRNVSKYYLRLAPTFFHQNILSDISRDDKNEYLYLYWLTLIPFTITVFYNKAPILARLIS